MSLRTPINHENEGLSSTRLSLQLVIPAQAGIHRSVEHRNPTWIPAFAGMTDPKAACSLYESSYTSVEDMEAAEVSDGSISLLIFSVLSVPFVVNSP